MRPSLWDIDTKDVDALAELKDELSVLATALLWDEDLLDNLPSPRAARLVGATVKEAASVLPDPEDLSKLPDPEKPIAHAIAMLDAATMLASLLSAEIAADITAAIEYLEKVAEAI